MQTVVRVLKPWSLLTTFGTFRWQILPERRRMCVCASSLVVSNEWKCVWPTSSEMDSSTLSSSSTSCLKVGLWLGTACQHSRIIMYLLNNKNRSFLTALQWVWFAVMSCGHWLQREKSVFLLTVHACSWRVYPCGVLPSAAWRAPPQGCPGRASHPA